jgi:hypothetical protein
MRKTTQFRLRPKNIVVGQRYKHCNFPDTEYLGSGNVTSEADSTLGYKVKNKQLVIIKCVSDPKMIGRYVNLTIIDNWFWDLFVKCDE